MNVLTSKLWFGGAQLRDLLTTSTNKLRIFNWNSISYGILAISMSDEHKNDDLFGDFVILEMFYCFLHILCVPGIQFQKD